ncbi:MAG: SAM-dependent methyltransferase [Bacteroidetes bacterium]|uniref:SAM-dependent methyltransferase n=1 Tax=Candidatus Egerieousia excrementavium TaxID=2840778 RepID=A0A9D9GYJ9_9BACT|nr:SAM-dependent methyltransferase [Candidatus Egerieousia excrementavium]
MELLPALDCFFAEELRTVRRYLSKAGLKGRLDSVRMYELNEHTGQGEIESYLDILLRGESAALVSEAGLPAVADPGAQLVALAHNHDIRVVPLSGPSSLMMALMASGMNGQCFAFTGYLPVKGAERRERIRSIEKISRQMCQSQIIIETPYRNQSLFEELIGVCSPDTRLCVAANITMEDEFIKTKTVARWRSAPVEIGKRPCVFVLMA